MKDAVNISALIRRNARYRPEHPAVVVDPQTLTWKAFHARINRCANMLRELGVSKGDKVATVLGNCLELLEVYGAAAKIGAVAVPLSPLLRPGGIATLLQDSDAKVVITNAQVAEPLAAIKQDVPHAQFLTIDGKFAGFHRYHDLCNQASDNEPPVVDINDDDPYNIIYSSGTTGLPKGIVLSHRVRAYYGSLFASAYRMTPESVVLHGGSIVFNGAFLTLMPWMYLGTKYVLMKAYNPAKFIDTVAEHKVTHVVMVPSQIVSLLNEPSFSAERLASLQMLCSVGAPLLEEHKKWLHEKLPGRLYELYGLTEGFMTVLDKTDVPRKMTSVGSLLPFFEMRIVNEANQEVPMGQPGEIVGRGPLLMTEYYKRKDLTAKAVVDGWLHTGDVGFIDEEGYLHLVDRQKDMIISGGVNVFPRDIEEVMARHPSVQEVAVFGVPSDKWGETPMAVVVLKQGQVTDGDALRTWTNERVEAKYQRVTRVVLAEDLPRGVTGKVMKRKLREQYADQ